MIRNAATFLICDNDRRIRKRHIDVTETCKPIDTGPVIEEDFHEQSNFSSLFDAAVLCLAAYGLRQ